MLSKMSGAFTISNCAFSSFADPVPIRRTDSSSIARTKSSSSRVFPRRFVGEPILFPYGLFAHNAFPEPAMSTDELAILAIERYSA